MQDKEIADMRKTNEQYQRNIKEIENDMTSGKKESDEQQKYEILYQKEKEINEFITKFEQEKTECEESIRDSQRVIQAVLEHMAKNI